MMQAAQVSAVFFFFQACIASVVGFDGCQLGNAGRGCKGQGLSSDSALLQVQGALAKSRGPIEGADACGCKIGAEGWSSTIQACRPESETSPMEAFNCAVPGNANPGAEVDACGCRIGVEGWSSTIQACRAESDTSHEEAAACAAKAPAGSAEVNLDACGCRPGEGWSTSIQRCRAESETSVEEAADCAASANTSTCLCVFDIDRTLTGKQGDTTRCPNNTRLWGMYDDGYGGGDATLSELSTRGISKTFCNECYLGICSAGHGSGASSPWNNYLLNSIMRSSPQDELVAREPSIKRWSYGTNVHSPYVLNQGNKVKQFSVEGIRAWYGKRGIRIAPSDVYFFGDRTENMQPFADLGLNSQEISCQERDWHLYRGSGLVGYCGATVAEIQRKDGNYVCAEQQAR